MSQYTPLDSIHTPIPTTSPPASWGQAIHSNFEYFRAPPGVVVRRTSAQPIPHGEITAIDWTATDARDTHNYHSHTSSPEKIVIPSGLGGWYDWFYQVRWASSSLGSRNAYLAINSTITTLAVEIHGSAANSYPQILSGKVFLPANAEVEFRVYQAIGSVLNVNSAEFGLFLVASA